MYYGLPIPNILLFVSFLTLAGVSFLIWWKAKAPAALLMLAGFGVTWLVDFLMWIGVFGYKSAEFTAWIFSLGIAVGALGFALTFWTKIQADVEHFRDLARDKLAQAAQRGAGDGAGSGGAGKGASGGGGASAPDAGDKPAS